MISALIIAGLVSVETARVEDLSWMAGYWLDCTGGREASETWSDPRQGLIAGHAVTVRGHRSRFELAHIRQGAGGEIALYAQPEGQAAVPFVLIETGPQRVVFSNPDNDFPHRIIYERVDDVLNARIEGADDDPERSAQWRLNLAPLNSRCPSTGVP